MHIYTLFPSFLQSFKKFCWAVSEVLPWEEKQDWLTVRLTDWRTDGCVKNIIPSATRCVGYNYFLESPIRNWHMFTQLFLKYKHLPCNSQLYLICWMPSPTINYVIKYILDIHFNIVEKYIYIYIAILNLKWCFVITLQDMKFDNHIFSIHINLYLPVHVYNICTRICFIAPKKNDTGSRTNY